MPQQTPISDRRAPPPPPALPFDLTRDSIEDWLRRLPDADDAQAGVRIYQVLRHFNRHTVDPQQRIELLAQFARPLAARADALADTSNGATFPLGGTVRSRSRLGSRLYAELATGYLMVFDSVRSTPRTISKPQSTLALIRAMESAYRSLIRIARIYEAPLTIFWKQLYAAFRFSERCGLLHTTLRTDEDRSPRSVASLFKRIVLLWLANPYRQHQHQIDQLVALLDMFADAAIISEDPPHDVTDPVFFVDLAAPIPPRHVSHSNGAPGAVYRCLDPRPVLSALTNFIDDPFSEAKRIDPAPDQDLLRRLIKTLGGTEERRHPRQAENIDVGFLVGLSNIIAAACDPEETSDHGPTNSDWRAPEVGTKYSLLTEEPGAFATVGTRAPSDERMTAEQIWGNTASAAEQRLPAACRAPGHVINSSAKGFLLMTPDDPSIEVRVGELIAIRQPSGPLNIGVVRWLASTPSSGIECGIELLSRSAECVRASFSVNAFRKEPVLFFEQSPLLNRPASIVVPHAKHRSGTRVELPVAGITRHYRLQKLIEIAPGFVHYALAAPNQ